MSLNGYSLKIAAEKLGIHRNTLTNYMGQNLIPRVNLEGLVLVPEPTMKNLLWMQSRGIPLTKYLFTDLPHDDGFKEVELKKVKEYIYQAQQSLQRYAEGRQSVKFGERYYQEIQNLQYQIRNLIKRQNDIQGNASQPINSGLGDNATMDPDTKYVQPEFLQLWGEPEEGAYKVEPFMYVGSPDDKSELLKELQDTIAEQERKLETEYRRDKANNLKLYELKELLKEKHEQMEEYMKLWMKAVAEIESKKDFGTKFTEHMEYLREEPKRQAKRERQAKLEKQRKSTPIDNIEQTNATPIGNKEYTPEEDARLRKMLDEAIKSQNLLK